MNDHLEKFEVKIRNLFNSGSPNFIFELELAISTNTFFFLLIHSVRLAFWLFIHSEYKQQERCSYTVYEYNKLYLYTVYPDPVILSLNLNSVHEQPNGKRHTVYQQKKNVFVFPMCQKLQRQETAQVCQIRIAYVFGIVKHF